MAEITTDDHIINLSAPDYKAQISTYSPNGLVPALIDGTIVIHDSLAICEYINECSKGALYPMSVKDRAFARSLCAEMHAGFTALRETMPFTLVAIAEQPEITVDIQHELDRVEEIFNFAALPYMFESPSVVDAYYAILAYRLHSYGITLLGKAGEYQQSLLHWPHLKAAISQAQSWSNSVLATQE